MIKVALVCPYPLHLMGGVGKHVLDFYRFLKINGYYVKVFSPSEEEINEDHVTFGKFIVLGGKSKIMQFLTNGSTTQWVWVRRRKARLPENFDIIHVHEPMLPLFYSASITKNNKGKKVATVHAVNPSIESKKNIILPFYKNKMNNIDFIIPVSEPSATMYKYLDKPMKVIPNGVYMQDFITDKPEIIEYKDGLKNLLFLGRFDKRKGLLYLLDAWNTISQNCNNQIRLIIAGKGSEKETKEIRDKIVTLVNKENIILEGFVSEDRKQQLMKTVDIFVSPATDGEAMGIVLVEAMSAKTPVVAFDNPGYNIVLQDRKEYCLAENKNVEDLAHKIFQILQNPELATELSEWGYNHVKNRYDWNVVGERILKVYQKLL